MSGMVKHSGADGDKTTAQAKRTPFLRRELPTIIAICVLLGLWFGLVAGG